MDLFVHIAHAAEEATATSPNVATMFGLNAKLFIAQLINFGIVLLVLWKWVFTPVTKALQKRTQKIEQALKHAEDMEVQKNEFEQWKALSMQEARKEAAGIVLKSKTDAEQVKTELLAKAKLEQEKLVEAGVNKLVSEQARLMHEARAKLADLVVQATEKVLGEKLNEKKDVELARKALENIK